MMRLVIEEVRDQERARIAQLALRRLAEPDHVLRQPGVIHAVRPSRDPGVGVHAQPAQLGEIADQAGALLEGHRRLRPAVEARHPGLVAPHEMAERAVDRAPEGAALPPALRAGPAAWLSGPAAAKMRRFISAL